MHAAPHRLGRDRALLLAGLACVTVIGWLVLARLGGAMTALKMASLPELLMAPAPGYGPTLAMWAVMMVAMMAPAALPGAAAYLALARRRHPDRTPLPAVASFSTGYLAAWLGYAALGAAAQSALASAMLLTPMGAIASARLAGAVLIAAGTYQLTPLKRVCLTHCRNPLLRLMGAWRDGAGGALRLGLGHGGWCVACCWALMALMFVLGLMNLAWMAVGAVFILAEKLALARWRLDAITGALLICVGAWMAWIAAC